MAWAVVFLHPLTIPCYCFGAAAMAKRRRLISREYHSWNREHIVIDTANRSVAQNVEILREALPSK